MSQDQAVAMDFLGIEKGSVKNESQTDENPVTAQAKQEPVATEQMTSPAASAPAEGNKMNFSQAFSLFSKHFNEKGIGNAAVGRGENVYVGNGKEDVKGSKPVNEENVSTHLGLYSQQTGFGSLRPFPGAEQKGFASTTAQPWLSRSILPPNSPAMRSAVTSTPSVKPPTAQLTIFYAGVVNVYDDVPADKAQAIMLLADSGNPLNASFIKPASFAQQTPVNSPLNSIPKTSLSLQTSVNSKMTTAVGNGREHTETTVCVTGATGFLASWLVKRLLDKGYTVHATVRDPGNEVKVRPLLDISGAAERLKLFKADLSEDGSFDAAVAGCQGVFHVATPIDFTPKDPENDVIKPAINGTLNVLKSCTKAQTVKRVVVTSSAATVSINESTEQNQELDESSWTDLDFLQTKKPPTWSYAVSKTLAEQAALQYGKEQGLDVVTIVPVLLAGPSILPDVPSSVHLALSLLTGNPHLLQAIKGMQLLSGSVSMVHVDDVCSAHIFLMDNPSAKGRYICCPVNTSVPQLADYLSKRYPQYNVPTEFEGVPQTQKLNMSSKKLVESGFSFKFGIDEIYDDAVEFAKAKGVLA